MKKSISIYILSITLLLGLGACKKRYEELAEDPNRPLHVPPSLVFRSAILGMHDEAWNSTQRWNQFWVSNYNYYDNQEYTWTNTTLSYTTLNNILQMENEAKRLLGTDQNPFAALGKFFRAYYYVEMTERVGDLPLSEALNPAITKPKYDAQKDIYIQSLAWLEESNTQLNELIAAGDKTLDGDIYYGNSLQKWQKAVNAYRLRVLISLSKKEGDTDLNIKQKFAAIIANPTVNPVFSSNDDNLQYTYISGINSYPLNPGNYGRFATRDNLSATYLNTLVGLNDPRTFVTSEPARIPARTGKKPDDFTSYIGASSGEDLATMSTKALNGEYSFIGRNRYYQFTGEPNIILGFAEQNFNMAEAANRGWIGADAETFYQNGVTASMNFYGLKDGGTVNTYDTLGILYKTVPVSLTDYLNQANVKYKGNNADGLNQILLQKYLAFFQNSGWEAFYNQRRTGVPTFLTGPGTGRSTIPVRWLYPVTERSSNQENYSVAVQRQYGGSETVDGVMWLLQ